MWKYARAHFLAVFRRKIVGGNGTVSMVVSTGKWMDDMRIVEIDTTRITHMQSRYTSVVPSCSTYNSYAHFVASESINHVDTMVNKKMETSN